MAHVSPTPFLVEGLRAIIPDASVANLREACELMFKSSTLCAVGHFTDAERGRIVEAIFEFITNPFEDVDAQGRGRREIQFDQARYGTIGYWEFAYQYSSDFLFLIYLSYVVKLVSHII